MTEYSIIFYATLVILDVLNNNIVSFDNYEFETAFSSDKLIKEEDFEDVLDFATLVVVASEDNEHISRYFIGGASKKLNSILNVCLGFPKMINEKFFNNTIKLFNEDVVAVENMGYLKNILNENA